MDKIIELLAQIQELAGAGIEALSGAMGGGEGGPAPEEGGGPPPEAAPAG
jgi:hypothetical protein